MYSKLTYYLAPERFCVVLYIYDHGKLQYYIAIDCCCRKMQDILQV